MPAPTPFKGSNKVTSEFLTALVSADKQLAQQLADQVFFKAFMNINAGKQNPYLEVDSAATHTMLEALKFAINAREELIKTQPPRLREESKEFLSQVKQYAAADNAINRGKILAALVTKYSKMAKEYNIGRLNNQQAKELLQEKQMQAENNFKAYCSSLLKKLDSVTLINEDERTESRNYLTGQQETVYKDYPVDTLIQQSLELIEFGKKIDDSIKMVKPQFAAENAKSISLAQKLVNSLFELVELISSLGDRLKVLLGLEEKEEQRKNLIWKQFKERNPEVLDNANKSKHTLELVTEELSLAQARSERGNSGELV